MRLFYFQPCVLLTLISIAQGDPNVVSAQFVGSSTTIDKTLLTFETDIQAPNQKVKLSINLSNDLQSVVDSITIQPPTSVFITAKAVKDKPHELTLTFPVAGKFLVTIQENGVSGRMRYRVSTDANHLSKVAAELVLENKSSYLLKDVDLNLDFGGMLLSFPDALDLPDNDDQYITFIKLATTSSNHVDLTKPFTGQNALGLKPLGYWAKVDDFKNGVAKSELQFPMKGNWPKYTVPGDILFQYDSRRLADFELPTNLAEATFKKVTTEDEAREFSSSRPEVFSETEYASLDLTQWPEIRFDVVYFTETIPVWVEVDPKTIIFANSKPQPGTKATTQIQFHPATNIKSTDLARLLSELKPIHETRESLNALIQSLTSKGWHDRSDAGKLPASEHAVVTALIKAAQQRDGMVEILNGTSQLASLRKSLQEFEMKIKRIDPVIQGLENTYENLKAFEVRISELMDKIVNGDHVEENRTKLEQAQKSVRDLLDSYRAWVNAFPA